MSNKGSLLLMATRSGEFTQRLYQDRLGQKLWQNDRLAGPPGG